MNRTLIVAVALSLGCNVAAYAQPVPEVAATAFGAAEDALADPGKSVGGPAASRRLDRKFGRLALDAPARAVPTAGGIDFTAGSDDSSASLRGVWIRSDPAFDAFRSWALTISTPVDDTGDTELASLSGLANATTVELKFSNVVAVGRRKLTRAAIEAFCGIGVEDSECRKKPGYNELYWKKDALGWIWGGAAKVGHEEFDYRDPVTLAELGGTKTPWSASAFLAFYPRRANPFLATLAYEHQDAWKAADFKTVCPAGPAPVVCVNGAIGAPTKEKKDLFSLEFRQRFTNFALAPVATYDAKDDVWGVEVPVYLLLNSDNALSGGVKFGWRSDDDDFRFGVFISQPFQVLTR